MEQDFKDSNGNTVSYKTWGDLRHPAILFFHGFPGSSTQGEALKKELAQNQRCVIAADRPGYGGSSPLRSLNVKDHILSLTELLDHHQIQRFSIVGVSGGAPMAHLMASRNGARVRSLSIVCGLATQNPETLDSFSRFQKRALGLRSFFPEFLLEPFINRFLRQTSPTTRMTHLLNSLNPTDQQVLGQAANYKLLLTSLSEAVRQGSKGILWDSALYNQDWLEDLCDHVSLSQIPIQYYHGNQDFILNCEMARQMNRLLPHSTLEIFEGEGHYSLPFLKNQHIIERML